MKKLSFKTFVSLLMVLVLSFSVIYMPGMSLDVLAADCSNGHTFIATEIGANYLKSGSSCGKRAVYYTSCSVCGLSSKGTSQETTFEYGEAPQHEWSTFVNVPADCTKDEHQKRTCTRCKQEYIRYVPDGQKALGHTFDYISNNNATCLENGTKTGKCIRCPQISTVTDEGSKLSHYWDVEKVIKEPTCETEGQKAILCKVCETIKEDSTERIPRLGHDWDSGSVKIPADCTKDGVVTYKCKRTGCGKTEDRKVDKLEHMYKEVKVPPTCENDGYSTFTCQCGDEYIAKKVESLGHDWSMTKTVVKESTCISEGSIAILCKRSRCNAIKEGSIEAIPFLGHKELIRSNGDGKHTVFCTRAGCGFSEESECSTTSHICGQIPVCDICKKEFGTVFGHIIEMIKDMPATCTQDGEIEYACEYCDYGYTERLDALGHTYPDNWSTILEPDCQSKGASIKVCLNCNNVISQTLPKTGHADLDGDNKCDTCDKTIAVVEPEKPSEPEKEPEEKPCDCDCHAGGIKAFFFKFLNFFAKLFDKSKRVCTCGTAH